MSAAGGPGKAPEGIVRSCACRGTNGLTHMSCLVSMALNADKNRDLTLWEKCINCKQAYRGHVKLALGWAIVKHNASGAEGDWRQIASLGFLGNGLWEVGRAEEAIPIFQAQLATIHRYHPINGQHVALDALTSMANCYSSAKRYEDALRLERQVHAEWVKRIGPAEKSAITIGCNLGDTLMKVKRFADAKEWLREQLRLARSALGMDDTVSLLVATNLCRACYDDTSDGGCPDDVAEADALLADTIERRRRVFGRAHPETRVVEGIGAARKAFLERAASKDCPVEDGVTKENT